MKSLILVLLLALSIPSAHANFGELCGDIIRVSSGYARIPTGLLEKFWNNITVPNRVKKFDRDLFNEARLMYLEKFKSGNTDGMVIYGVFELEAAFLDAIIETKTKAQFDIDLILTQGSASKKKAFYRVIREISKPDGHSEGELKRMMGELYEITYSDAVITKRWTDKGMDSAAKYHFMKIAEERMATRGFVSAFRDLGLIHSPSQYSKFLDFIEDPIVVTAIDIGLNYGLVTRSPVIFAKPPGQKFASWIKFPMSVKRKILLGNYEGAWAEMSPLLKTKVKADVGYQAIRHGVNSVMPYLTALSIGYLVVDRWTDWKKENPSHKNDIPPLEAWPKPKKKALSALLESAPNADELDLTSAKKTFKLY